MAPTFLSLPGEIRNRIYTLAFTTTAPITDANSTLSLAPASKQQRAGNKPPTPVRADSFHEDDGDSYLTQHQAVPLPQTPHHAIPPLGVPLLRTCRLVHAEAPVSLLYARNVFRFTSVSHCRTFLAALPPWLRAAVHDVEVDVRDISPSPLPHPETPGAVNREWPQYLSWRPVSTPELGSLRVDAPGLTTLRLDFSAWPRARLSRRHLWDILRRLLHNVEGLDRVVLKGFYAKGTAMERREPWDPAYYVGTDEVTTEGVVERMWGTVKGSVGPAATDDGTDGTDGDKIIRWERDGEGNIALEIVSLEHLSRTRSGGYAHHNHHHHATEKIELVTRQSPTDPWPASGACAYEEYLRRKDPLWFACTSRRINPIVFV